MSTALAFLMLSHTAASSGRASHQGKRQAAVWRLSGLAAQNVLRDGSDCPFDVSG